MTLVPDLSALTAEEKLAYGVVSKYGAMWVRAQVIDVKGESVQIAVDGETIAMYYPALKLTYPLSAGQWVECLKVGEGYLVLGRANVASDEGVPPDSISERTTSVQTELTNFKEAHVGTKPGEDETEHERVDRILAAHGDRISSLENYREGHSAGPGRTTHDNVNDNIADKANKAHGHDFDELPNNGKHNAGWRSNGFSGNKDSQVGQHVHEWGHLPNNGNHGDGLHTENYSKVGHGHGGG